MSDAIHKRQVLGYLEGTTIFFYGGIILAIISIAFNSAILLFLAGVSIGCAIPLIRLELLIKKGKRFSMELGDELERRHYMGKDFQ